MFCFQCEQTCKGTGCTAAGVCGKTPEAAELMDLLDNAIMGMSWYARRARALGRPDREADLLAVESLFTTITNVNFDPDRLEEWVRRAVRVRDRLKGVYEDAGGKEEPSAPARWQPAADRRGLLAQAGELSIARRLGRHGADVAGLQEMVRYGLKGLAAYADHARILGVEDDSVHAFVHEALDFLGSDPAGVDALVGMALRVGEENLKVMEMLDRANTSAYGHPEPTKVRVTPVAGKCIVVSGHDLKDLEELLKQTQGKGINVYTHGEMLPANAYPGLKKYKHLVGNYGGAWQEQRKEFAQFPGAVLMTTNCIQNPKGYEGRIFTTGLVGWPGVRHITDRDFSPVIEAAMSAPGFQKDEPEKTLMTGFARNAVLSVAGAVVDAVKAGKIRRFFLIGGCDGAKPGRSYYTDLALAVPKDCVILTLACGKYRFNKLDFGDIGGIPRLLDMGQCNDAHSAVQVAVALSKAFGCGVNDLPLSFVLSWYEQKAVVILLSLLHLGIRNIRIGPSLPAFVGPGVLKVLVEKWGLKPVTTPEADLKEMMGPVAA